MRKIVRKMPSKDSLHKTVLGRTGLSISPVGFGILPMGPAQLALPVSEGAAVLAYALKRGINFIDTAQYYRTYPYIREGLKLYYREHPQGPAPVICSKSLTSDYDEMMEAIEEACSELDVPRIDIFLLHEVRTGQFEERREAWRALLDAKARGLVKAVGISTHHADVAADMAAVPECDVVFPLINAAGMGIRNGAGPGSREDMEAAIGLCKAAGKGVFTMKAFGGGNLTGRYQKALDYVFSLEAVDAVMIGFGHTSEIDDLMSYLSGTMAPDYNPDVTAKKMYVNQEDCEGCGRCKSICAAAAVYYNENGLAAIDHARCLTCGYCAQGCPTRASIMY